MLSIHKQLFSKQSQKLFQIVTPSIESICLKSEHAKNWEYNFVIVSITRNI